LFLSGLSNRPANALGGEGDDLLAQLRDGVSLGAHWFAPLLKKQSRFSAELLGDENEARTEINSPRRGEFLSGTKNVLVNFVRGTK
jgi:hypothetical protein